MSKKVWGSATWYLFHTLSFKLKQEYENYAQELFIIFELIAASLPCPQCAEHAKQRLRQANKRAINNREAIMQVMFEFHNYVNMRLGKRQITREEHDKLYIRADTSAVIKHFNKIFTMKHNDEKGMIYSWSRKISLERLNKFINEHNYIFEH